MGDEGGAGDLVGDGREGNTTERTKDRSRLGKREHAAFKVLKNSLIKIPKGS